MARDELWEALESSITARARRLLEHYNVRFDHAARIASDGELWFHEQICMDSPIRLATSACNFVERVARTMVDPMLPIGFRVDGHVGKPLGDELGVPFVAEASDDIERVWEDGEIELIEEPDWQFLIEPLGLDQDDPKPSTRVRVASSKHREAVLAALA